MSFRFLMSVDQLSVCLKMNMCNGLSEACDKKVACFLLFSKSYSDICFVSKKLCEEKFGHGIVYCIDKKHVKLIWNREEILNDKDDICICK